MNFKSVIQEYGYPIVSKEVANKVHGAKPGNTRWQQLHGTYIDNNTGKLSTHYNYKKWEYLLDAGLQDIRSVLCSMKKRPSLQYEKQTGKKPILGLMAAESQKRKTDYRKLVAMLLRKSVHRVNLWDFGLNKTFYNICMKRKFHMHQSMVI